MKLLGAAALMLLLVVAGCGGPEKAPLNLRLEADSDSTVKVIWSVPVDGVPDKYSVYFKAAGETAFSLVAETTANLWTHDPQGRTGWYAVESRFGDQSYRAALNASTMPVRNDTVALAELNAAGNSGYGWDAATGRARTWPMNTVTSCRSADFYITDFKPSSSNQLPYSVASPDMGPADAGDVVPTGAWRTVRFSDPLAGENVLLPQVSDVTYFNYTDITAVPCFIGCYTPEGRYALIKVVGVDAENHWARVETWFQMIPGLRLTAH
jgi:hypothetical protein